MDPPELGIDLHLREDRSRRPRRATAPTLPAPNSGARGSAMTRSVRRAARSIERPHDARMRQRTGGRSPIRPR
jgi:hypothetical protein